MKKLIFFLSILILPCSVLFSAGDYYQFSTPAQQQRFETLTGQLRCLVCQNQNLSSSNAPLAEDLRNQVFQQIQQGQSDKQIIDYLIARYGDFVLYRPPFNIMTIGLWLGPFVLLIIGISCLILYIKRREQNQ